MSNRRHFIAVAAATAAGALIPLRASAASTRHVVVVGGGMAGATMAKYLRLWSGRTINVTLVEQNATYVSNIMSNLAVTGQLAMSRLNFGYSKLVSSYGVKLVTASVTAVEPAGAGLWKVQTRAANGSVGTLYADRVVLAPGIQMDPVQETSGAPGQAASILHAWIAGSQTELLRQKLAAMPAGGTFLMSIPPKPYRCPPGPYERACVVADYLKRNKPNSKIVVLDANPGITAEPENFGYAFNTLYPDVLQYIPNAKVVSVDSASGTVTADVTVANGTTGTELKGQQFFSNVLNVIPPHRAGAIVQLAGLANSTDKPFAQVWPWSFESTEKPGLHVIGDAHRTIGDGGTGLPMAGHVGNQEAKICASAIINLFGGKEIDTAYLTANSACYSPVSSTLASWLTAVYHYDSAGSKKFIMHDYPNGTTGIPTEALKPSGENFSKMNTWFKSLMTETYS